MSTLSAIFRIVAVTLVLWGGNNFSVEAQKKNKNSATEIEESDRRAAEFYFIEGEKYFILEDYAKSLSAFQQCLDITPDNSAVHFKIADIMYRNEEYQQAESSIEKALNFDDSNKFYYLLAADISTANGNMDNATFYYERMLARIPGTERYYTELAGLYLYQNKLDEALRAYENAEDKLGITDQISLQKQQIYLKQNNIEKAILTGQDLVDAFPGEPQYVVALAEVMHSNGKEEDAVTLLNNYLEEFGSNSSAKLVLSGYYRQAGKMDESSKLVRESFHDPSLDLDIKTQVLVKYIARFPDETAVDDALALGEILVEVHPDDGDTYLVNGDMLTTLLSFDNVNNGQSLREKSIYFYSRSLTFDPSNYSVWQNLLNLDLQLRKWDSLGVHAEKALETFPNQPMIYFFMGISLSQKNNYEEAIVYLEQGKKMATNNPQLLVSFYSSLGTAYHAVGDHKSSDKAFDSAIELNPYDDILLNNYSYYLSLRKERLDKASKMSLEVVRRNPDNATYLDTYAWVLYQLEEYDESKRILEKVIQSSNANAVHFDHYGDVLYQLGDVDEAVLNWEKAKELDKNTKNIDKKINKRKIVE